LYFKEKAVSVRGRPFNRIDANVFHDYNISMISTVTTKNMVSIPQAISRQLGIKPGWKLDWLGSGNPDEIVVRVIPDRAEAGRRLLGKGKNLAPGRDSVSELVAERESEQ
jgi:bifunctional DNA-binding transcriptional regulator/antitoxin component of YhaV-PrlF toxin-antitoxin module